MKREGREESHILMDKTQTGYMEEVAFQWGLWDVGFQSKSFRES